MLVEAAEEVAVVEEEEADREQLQEEEDDAVVVDMDVVDRLLVDIRQLLVVVVPYEKGIHMEKGNNQTSSERVERTDEQRTKMVECRPTK